ncbi:MULTISPECIES: molybdenum cofactor biosynthesis protein MoaE [unclassified Marichromatium]|uniref:molybdenum cofactor biosynthesis protein MoaE n=1 Tax=unclassified Marichromatium TaxID=2618417 RepID=UPI000F3C05E8|nr:MULTISPECIES: molybdenum cofactor biosynthesis protein MoaE [unclassified Marichromatium]MBO8086024.1 molybdenum cofactor biosynthesis protein MoaE [Marichromatium sp.]RNE92046.1 molybdenum cofactor biosynthesis protein MoaE [Marichromatium sp. AB31]RNE94088.1 molybdenum cofactor biosynthesis protein MoaE [Marichromatium sp. AB32]
MRQVRVQHEPLDPLAEQAVFNDTDGRVGAVVSFTGLMREFGAEGAVDGMFLEHYPGMTEQALDALAAQAEQHWPLTALVLVHRVGWLAPGDPIVFVGVSSAHRAAAFRACEFLIDALKTRVPLWKKETSGTAERWVEARDSDEVAARRWTEATARDPE